jgi:sec-independent protein translocase protein TatB
MFDIGWSEMALIMAVALVVIGPKDLPRLARQIGKWSGKARAMAREFQRSLDDMAREAELQDIKAEIDRVSRTDIGAEIDRAVDPDGELKRAIAPPPAAAFALPEPTEPTARTEPKAIANAGEPPAMPVLPAPASQPSLPDKT